MTNSQLIFAIFGVVMVFSVCIIPMILDYYHHKSQPEPEWQRRLHLLQLANTRIELIARAKSEHKNL